MFIGFTNIYCQFINRFSKIMALLTSILKILKNKILFILQISNIGTIPKKNNNIKSNRNDNNGSSMTIKKSSSTRNLNLKLCFLTSRAKIAFI